MDVLRSVKGGRENSFWTYRDFLSCETHKNKVMSTADAGFDRNEDIMSTKCDK